MSGCDFDMFAYVVASEDNGWIFEISSTKYCEEFGNLRCTWWFTCKSLVSTSLLMQKYDGFPKHFMVTNGFYFIDFQRNRVFHITTLIIPKQESTSDSVCCCICNLWITSWLAIHLLNFFFLLIKLTACIWLIFLLIICSVSNIEWRRNFWCSGQTFPLSSWVDSCKC